MKSANEINAVDGLIRQAKKNFEEAKYEQCYCVSVSLMIIRVTSKAFAVLPLF
jgi:hypothetical protein